MLLSEETTAPATAAGFPATLAELMPDCGLFFNVATPSPPQLQEPELGLRFKDVVPSAATAEPDGADNLSVEVPCPFPRELTLLDEEPDRGDILILIDASPQLIEPDSDLALKLIDALSSMLAEPDRDVIPNLGEALIEPDCDVIHCLASASSPLLVEPDWEVIRCLVDGRSSTSSKTASPPF